MSKFADMSEEEFERRYLNRDMEKEFPSTSDNVEIIPMEPIN